ncbi:MAG TPA: M14 family zinc carboxypeptidase [Cellulomonas sp.]
MHDFPTVDALLAWFDALAVAHPDLVRRRRVGTSRLGEPIPMFSIGSGPRAHLLFAGVHPNEPIGFRTLQHLAAELVADPALRTETNATWHLVPCIDPDGTRLNEGWFADPGDRIAYARRFYRPAPAEQAEWTFPLAHKDAYFDAVIPETQALMRLIDELRPDVMVSLHNAELGGVYYYLSEDVPGAVEALHAVPAALGLPLDTGEPESPHLVRLAPAVFRAGSAADDYDYLESLGLDPGPMVSGEGSAQYARRHGTVTLIAELPYWSHPSAEDTGPSGVRYAEVVRERAAGLTALTDALTDLLDRARPDLTVRSPFLRATEAFVPGMAGHGVAEARRADLLDGTPEGERIATVAEVFSNQDVIRCFRLRYGGMLLRALEAEVVAGVATARTRRVHEQAAELYAEWAEEARTGAAGLQVLDVHRLVGVQYGATLALSRLVGRRDGTLGPLAVAGPTAADA